MQFVFAWRKAHHLLASAATVGKWWIEKMHPARSGSAVVPVETPVSVCIAFQHPSESSSWGKFSLSRHWHMQTYTYVSHLFHESKQLPQMTKCCNCGCSHCTCKLFDWEHKVRTFTSDVYTKPYHWAKGSGILLIKLGWVVRQLYGWVTWCFSEFVLTQKLSQTISPVFQCAFQV